MIVIPRLQRTAIISPTGEVEGDWSNPLLHRLSPTVLNITDAVTPTYTLAKVASGLKISGTIFNKHLLFSTDVMPFLKPVTRLIMTVRPSAVPADFSVGMGFRDGGGSFLALGWQNNGWLRQNLNGTLTQLKLDLPTFGAGDELSMQFDISADGRVAVTCQKNGGARTNVAVTGVPTGQAYIYWFDDSVAAAATVALVEQMVAAPAAFAGMFTAVAPTGWGRRLPPSGFVASRILPDIGIYKHPTARLFATNVDLKPPLGADDPGVFSQYVDIATGNDAHAGTETSPLKSIHQAIVNAGVGSRAAIFVKGDLYDFANCWCGAKPVGAETQVISWDGAQVISSMHDAGLTWALDTGATYSATFANAVVNVFDALHPTSDGDYSALELAASLALCRSTAGTYFVSGTTIYVHTSDGRVPDTNIRVYKSAGDNTPPFGNGYWTASGTMYLGNISFEGGCYAFYTDTNGSPLTWQQTIYGRDCTFKYSAQALGSAPIVNGDVLAIWQRCISAWNGVDGFHYNPISGSANATGIEIDCVGRWSGRGGGSINNNSSNHGGATIRVKTADGWGDYHHAEHRGIHDILETNSSLSWHLGITSRDSRNGFANLAVGLGSGAEKMWNDSCTSSGATNDQEAAAGATVYDFDLSRSATDTGAGTFATYTP